MFRAAAWDVVTLGHSHCTTRTTLAPEKFELVLLQLFRFNLPSFVCTFCGAFWSTTVRISLELLALLGTLSPARLACTLRAAVRPGLVVTHGELPLVLLARRLSPELLEGPRAHFRTLGLVVAVRKDFLILLTRLLWLLLPESLPAVLGALRTAL